MRIERRGYKVISSDAQGRGFITLECNGVDERSSSELGDGQNEDKTALLVFVFEHVMTRTVPVPFIREDGQGRNGRG